MRAKRAAKKPNGESKPADAKPADPRPPEPKPPDPKPTPVTKPSATSNGGLLNSR